MLICSETKIASTKIKYIFDTLYVKYINTSFIRVPCLNYYNLMKLNQDLIKITIKCLIIEYYLTLKSKQKLYFKFTQSQITKVVLLRLFLLSRCIACNIS